MNTFASSVNSDKSCSTPLIDGDGTFNVAGIENFIKDVKLSDCGLSYAVVAIMGPQSSGICSPCPNDLFLMNYVFWIRGLVVHYQTKCDLNEHCALEEYDDSELEIVKAWWDISQFICPWWGSCVDMKNRMTCPVWNLCTIPLILGFFTT